MLWSALLFGLLGSLHCASMCGPLALIVNGNGQKSYLIWLYHLGRVVCYICLGALFGIIGKGLYISGLQQSVSIASGILMIGFVLLRFVKYEQLPLNNFFHRIVGKFKKQLGRQILRRNRFLIGFLNGFLPCGLLYAALFGAISMSSLQGGMIYMFFFGLGTVPLLMLTLYLGKQISMRYQILQRFVPVMIAMVGVLLILRGLGLDIHFLSPSYLDLMLRPDADCVTGLL